MKSSHEDAPGWVFAAEEISAGVYQVKATDQLGRCIEATGMDYIALLEDVVRKARIWSNKKR